MLENMAVCVIVLWGLMSLQDLDGDAISNFLIDCCPANPFKCIYIVLTNLTRAQNREKHLYDHQKPSIKCADFISIQFQKNAIDILPSLRRNLLLYRYFYPSIPHSIYIPKTKLIINERSLHLHHCTFSIGICASATNSP
jgi:hypothetical protein